MHVPKDLKVTEPPPAGHRRNMHYGVRSGEEHEDYTVDRATSVSVENQRRRTNGSLKVGVKYPVTSSLSLIKDSRFLAAGNSHRYTRRSDAGAQIRRGTNL